MKELKSYIDKNKKRYLDELLDFLKIPSVSADPKYKKDVKNAAVWLKNKMKEAGIAKTKTYKTAGHQIV